MLIHLHFYRPSAGDPTLCHWCGKEESLPHSRLPPHWKTALTLVAFKEGVPIPFRPYDLRKATDLWMTPIVKADNAVRGLARAGIIQRIGSPQPRARGVPRGPKAVYWRLTADGVAWVRGMPRAARGAVVAALAQGSLHV